MKSRMILGAIFKFRNLGILAAALGAAALLNNQMPLPYGVAVSGGILVYLIFVMQTLMSKQFHEEFNEKEKVRRIQDLNYQCSKLSNEARRYTNSAYLQKLKKVMEDKNDIMNSFLKGERGYIKEKIVEQTLTLVLNYIRLLTNFCIRSRELSSVDVSAVAERINTNNRKLSFSKDVRMADDIRKVIEMDQKMINRLKEEKKDLERVSAKLDYMESTVNMFKHQVLSSVETEDMLEKLETAVNEAEALDNVLEGRRKNKLRGF